MPPLPSGPGRRLWVARGSGVMRFASGGAWMPLDSTTVGAVSVPAFCYTGTLQLGLGRLLWCRGREALRRCCGAMEWRLWSGLPLARSEGGHLDQSALLRWLAEAVCFPPALLPSDHLAWLPAEADPQCSAVARLTLAGTVVTATLTFDDEGRFLELRSDDYWRVTPDGSVARNTWVARGGAHRRFRRVQCDAGLLAVAGWRAGRSQQLSRLAPSPSTSWQAAGRRQHRGADAAVRGVGGGRRR